MLCLMLIHKVLVGFHIVSSVRHGCVPCVEAIRVLRVTEALGKIGGEGGGRDILPRLSY